MAMSRLLSKSAVRNVTTAAAASSSMTKAAGDISSVFPSLRPDYKPEPLPPRFQDLKRTLFKANEEALKDSWKRLLAALEKEVEKIREQGSNVRFHLCQSHLIFH
jgi:glucuronate isomerase